MKFLTKLLLTTALFSSVAQAGLVVIVNPEGPDALSKSQVSKLYLGKAKKLPNGQKVTVLEHANGTADRQAFHAAVTGKTEAQLQAYWSRLVFTGKGRPPKILGSSSLIKNQVSANSAAIGYIDEAEVDSSVKVVFKL